MLENHQQWCLVQILGLLIPDRIHAKSNSFTQLDCWKYLINDYSYRGILWSMIISCLPLTLHTSAHDKWSSKLMTSYCTRFRTAVAESSIVNLYFSLLIAALAYVSAPSALRSSTRSCHSCLGTICLAISASHLYHFLALLKLHFPYTPKQRNSWVISSFRFREALCGTYRGLTLKIPFFSHLKFHTINDLFFF